MPAAQRWPHLGVVQVPLNSLEKEATTDLEPEFDRAQMFGLIKAR